MRIFRAWCVAGFTLWLLCACAAPPPDEERIRQIMTEMTESLAEGNVRDIFAHLAEDFDGETWNLDRRALRLLVRREMRSRRQLSARLFDIDVTVLDSERARVDFQVLMTGGSGLIPSEGRWFQVQSGWRKDDDWQLISARWEDVIGR